MKNIYIHTWERKRLTPSFVRTDNEKGLHSAFNLSRTFLVDMKHTIKCSLIFLSKEFSRNQFSLLLNAHKNTNKQAYDKNDHVALIMYREELPWFIILNVYFIS
ncbi:hypothetical protein AK88_04944 [Plasmodium fragile]|uniref:Uncharacterized protein n=1 Tax=Plasmodium fragile TaxID=5857 RepID=A0A0D9QEC0_PLAFR|nr:uncharacterized protein AK88_04944 [Plasmodium fragile]KJP85405.1 hypothetical protein AK88_04944 [Plasmodium fragile]